MTDPANSTTDPRPQAATESTEFFNVRSPAILGGLIAVIWVVAVSGFLIFGSSTGAASGWILSLFAIFLPLALIGLAVVTLRALSELRAEAARLHASLDAMRRAQLSVGALNEGGSPVYEPAISKMTLPSREGSGSFSSFTTHRDPTAVQQSDDRKSDLIAPSGRATEPEQSSLALGTPVDAVHPPLAKADFIRALQFPENPDDQDGFRALRSALEDRTVAKLIRSSQDVLTLLSQEGIYMDDLPADRTRPELWRRLANGERGRTIGSLGAVRDRSSLALAAGRMREDEVFRDAVLHFLRTFDRVFADFEKNATDSDLIGLAETRTVRAFMLLGRVAGMFGRLYT